MSTICVVVMATYGRTLCWEKRNTVPNTSGVFAVGAIKQTMDITDVKRLWITPLGVVGAYSGPSGAPPVTPVAPNRCPCAMLLIRDAESYAWPERVLLLDSVKTVVSIGHSRSTSSRGGVVSVFAGGFNVLATGGGCTDFIVYGNY